MLSPAKFLAPKPNTKENYSDAVNEHGALSSTECNQVAECNITSICLALLKGPDLN